MFLGQLVLFVLEPDCLVVQPMHHCRADRDDHGGTAVLLLDGPPEPLVFVEQPSNLRFLVLQLPEVDLLDEILVLDPFLQNPHILLQCR